MIEERIAEIKEELNSFDDDLLRYSFLVELSAYIPSDLPDLMKEEFLYRGCQSRVWVRYRVEEERFFMEATSDTLIIRGVLYVMSQLYNELSPEEISARKIDFTEECGISRHFSGQRNTGISGISDSIYEFCSNYLKTV